MTNEEEKASRALRGKKLVAFYQRVFGSKEGKKVLYDLMRNNFVLGSTFSQESDSLTLIREGQRNSILRILTILKLDPEQFMQQPEEEPTHVS